MDYYTEQQLNTIQSVEFQFVEWNFSEHVLTITLDRAEKKNALHPYMVNELAFLLNYAHIQKEVWSIIIEAKGNIFCAGADLKAFMGDLGNQPSSVASPQKEVLMAQLFKEVHKPIIANVEGDVYAGGFFFLTGSTYVVASENVKLGLPEVKRGLFPFQVMASLIEIIPARKVIDWCIRGNTLSAKEALDLGVVTHVTSSGENKTYINSLIQEIHKNSPTAIRLGLEAYSKITESSSEHSYLMKMLKQTIQTKDGQEGLLAFKEKRQPHWTGE